jgi:hypothetical protein
MKLAFIAAEKAFPVSAMGPRLLRCRHGYYAYMKRRETKLPTELELQSRVRGTFSLSFDRSLLCH